MNTASSEERNERVVPTGFVPFDEVDLPVAFSGGPWPATVFMGGRDNGPAMTGIIRASRDRERIP
jgi:hypothetical protein